MRVRERERYPLGLCVGGSLRWLLFLPAVAECLSRVALHRTLSPLSYSCCTMTGTITVIDRCPFDQQQYKCIVEVTFLFGWCVGEKERERKRERDTLGVCVGGCLRWPPLLVVRRVVLRPHHCWKTLHESLATMLDFRWEKRQH